MVSANGLDSDPRAVAKSREKSISHERSRRCAGEIAAYVDEEVHPDLCHAINSVEERVHPDLSTYNSVDERVRPDFSTYNVDEMYLRGDTEDSGPVEEPFEQTNPDVVDGKNLFEKDIMLTEAQWEQVLARKGLAAESRRWPEDASGTPRVKYPLRRRERGPAGRPRRHRPLGDSHLRSLRPHHRRQPTAPHVPSAERLLVLHRLPTRILPERTKHIDWS
nr:uncharacterized protein LOC113817588 [Penaeus vannamei]